MLRGSLPQRLSFGLDLAQTNLHGERGGTVPPFGETFPSKPFPDTRYRTAGAFVQSEIDTDRFSIIPALRFDKFSLVPTSSSGFGGETVSLGDQAVTPRLGAIDHECLGPLPPNVTVLRAGLPCEPCWKAAPLAACFKRIDCLARLDVDRVERAVRAVMNLTTEENHDECAGVRVC